MIDQEPAYGKQYHCHTCRKVLKTEFISAHKVLGHQVEGYITSPRSRKPEIIEEPPIEDSDVIEE